MTSLLLWTAAFAYLAAMGNKDRELANDKIFWIHIFLTWALFMFNVSAFKMLGWTIGNYDSISKYFYVNVGPLPEWVSLVSWAGQLVIGLLAMLAIFQLIRRVDRGRKLLLILLPLMYLFAITEALRGFYASASSEAPLQVAISINAILFGIPVVAIYFFYTRNNVKEQLFLNTK